MSDRQQKSVSWKYARQAERALGGVVGISSWDESDDTGNSIVETLSDLLERARQQAGDAGRRAASRIKAAAESAMQWATDAAARVSLIEIARQAGAFMGSALGATVPTWVWLLAAVEFLRSRSND